MKTTCNYFAQYSSLDSDVNSVISISMINKFNPLISRTSPITDCYDLLVLVVTAKEQQINYLSHYIKDDLRIQERWIHMEGLEQWIMNGENRNVIHWILHGEILIDKNDYMRKLRQDLIEFPHSLREQKLMIEFSHFLRRYVQAKDYIRQDQTLDAYNNVLEALQHWAKICIIEKGQHPELMVWKQLKDINLGVYKLYEELTLSTETLEQKVELVLLASEFSAMSKMKDCCKILLEVISSRNAAWTANELKYHPKLNDLHIDISLVLRKLAKKDLIIESPHRLQGEADLLEIRYTPA